MKAGQVMSEIRLTCPSDWTILGLSGSENGAALGFEKTKVRFERGQDGSATVDKMKRRMKEPHMSRVAGGILDRYFESGRRLASMRSPTFKP